MKERRIYLEMCFICGAISQAGECVHQNDQWRLLAADDLWNDLSWMGRFLVSLPVTAEKREMER